MFQGRWPNTLHVDAKNRLSLPAVFRARDDGEVLDTFMLGNLLDPCLYLHSRDQHKQFVGRLYRQLGDSRDSRLHKTVTLSRFVPVSVDANGRVTIPAWLLQAAGIQKEVILISQESRVEVWGCETFAQIEGAEGLRPEVAEALERVFAEEEREMQSNIRGEILGREGGNPSR